MVVEQFGYPLPAPAPPLRPAWAGRKPDCSLTARVFRFTVKPCSQIGEYTMSTEENKAIVSRFFEEVFNKKNLAFLDEYATPDAVDHLVPPNMPPGREGSK